MCLLGWKLIFSQIQGTRTRTSLGMGHYAVYHSGSGKIEFMTDSSGGMVTWWLVVKHTVSIRSLKQVRFYSLKKNGFLHRMAGLFFKIIKVCTTSPLKHKLSHLQQTLQWPLDPLWNMVQLPEHYEIARNFGIISCTRPRSKMLAFYWFGTEYTHECRLLSLIFLWGIGPLSWLDEGPDAAKSISPEDPYWNRSQTLEISLRWQAFVFSWDLVDNLWHLEVLPWCLDVLLLLVPQTQAPVWTTSWW